MILAAAERHQRGGRWGKELESPYDITMTIEIGQEISHYRILEKLGEGGMGVIYKAEDTKLRRTVALKFLPHHLLANEEDKTRFLHEAQAASALSHPNIMTIHEIDEVEGETFIAMECIEGESLKDKLEKGPVKPKELLKLAIQIAEGLHAAHEAEIIHRDIKSENIMISKTGLVKIMDFGIAKRRGVTRVTKEGSTLGTLAYMSPEQAEGLEVDRRSDLFSFGVVLYEMATGQLPFKGEHDATILYAIVNEEPLPVTTLNPNIPKELERFIHKALEKEVEARYQHGDDLGADLKKLKKDLETSFVSGLTLPKQEKSIVVLPFEDISPGRDNEYFSDGLTEEIITDLSQIHSLRVISRTSAMMLKGIRKSIRTIGRELNVQYVLEGSVRKAGNNLRISAQLIDATSDAHLWAEKYSGTLDNIFDIQEQVSRSIVDALKLKLNPKESKIISTKPIENLKAYECYLKARHEYWHFTEDALERSLQLLQNGFEIVGENELLYAAKGTIYWQYVNAMLKPGKNYDNYLKEADECAKKVFELNPDSSVGHVLKGAICQNSGNPNEAIRHFKRAVEIDSNNPEALMWLGYMYAVSGKETVGRGFIEKAAELDPLTPISQGVPGWIDTFEGNFSAAVEDWHKMYQMDSENPLNRWVYAWSLAMDNRIKDALAILESIEINASQMKPWENLCLFQKYSLRGQKEDALQSVTSELTEASKWDDVYSLFMAECYSFINEPDLAIDWLENTIHYGIINYPFLNEYDSFLENIRGEERFKKLMERVKYEWENFEV